MTTCVLTSNLGLGDMFTMNGAARKLLENYEKVIVVCKPLYYHTVKQMYSDENKIVVYPLNLSRGCVADVRDPIYKQVPNIEFKFCGLISKAYWKIKEPFFKNFYIDLGFEYSDKDKYQKVIRDHELEENIYNKFKAIYGDKYIFTHDHRGFVSHFNPRSPVFVEENKDNLPIFHPNINYYNYNKVINSEYLNLWSGKWGSTIFNNILNYCKIIENATEIHIRDSCFSCLCPFLDLSKVKRKIIHSEIDKPTLIEYSNTFQDWEVVHLK